MRAAYRRLVATFRIGLGATAGCGSDPASPPPPPGRSLTIAARPGTDDTIQATPTQPLVVEVRRSDGGLAVGSVVRFAPLVADTLPGQLSMLVRENASGPFAAIAEPRTDSRGRASVLVQFWIVAGPGNIVVTVPDLGLVDTVRFMVRPGAVASLGLTPRDTVLPIGASAQIRARPRDRLGNGRQEQVTFAATSAPNGAGAVTPSGSVVATSVGRVRVVGRVGTTTDSTLISVVPLGNYWVVDLEHRGLAEYSLSGNLVRRILIPDLLGDVEPALASDGRDLAIAPVGTPRQIAIVSVAGSLGVIPWPPGAPDAYWPAFSPDGSTIYFSGVRGVDPTGIWRIKRDGTGLTQITSGIHYRPNLSPDGRFLVFHSFDGTTISVHVFDLVMAQYLPRTLPGRFPEWSPRSGIAYLSNNGGLLMSATADLAQTQAITDGSEPLADGQLAWSPDGLWLLGRCPSVLCLVDPRTGQVMPLSYSTSLSQPVWSLTGVP